MVIILGAGPAGLSAAYHTQSDYLILEKESTPGGLCRSFELGGATFDLGGHAFFTRHDYVKNLISELSPIPLYQQPRAAWVHSHNTYVPYPFQANLYGLPTQVVKDCLLGLIHAAKTPPKQAPAHMYDWIYQSFGEGIAQHFMLPYNQKIWAHPLDSIVPTWASDRIVAPDIETIVAGALERKDFKHYPNATVTYPSEGGFANLYKGFEQAVDTDNTLQQETVETIDPQKKCIVTASGKTYDYQQLISTIPLTELVKKTINAPSECQLAAEKLRHFSLHLVNLVYDRPNITDKHRIYCASPNIPFHKLVMNSNSSPSLRDRSVFSFQAEISFSAYKPVDAAGLEDRVINALLDMQLISPDDRLIACDTRTLPLAYPVYTNTWEAARKTLFTYYEAQQIYCAGRFGEWLYINSDTAVMRGKLAAEKIGHSH